MDITVVSGAGTHPGADIHEPLLSTEAAAVARGTAEIDAAWPSEECRIEIPLRASVRCGQLVAGFDSDTGLQWRGKIVSVGHRISTDQDGAQTQITTLGIRRTYAPQ